jgi:predicted secreted Zn-dependent protease
MVDHESGHKALAVEAGEKVELEILSMGPKGNCTLLKRAANRLGQKIIEEYNARSERYDRETDDGENRGPKLREGTRNQIP